MSVDRASCWSITINNPTEQEVVCNIPGWSLSGQYEQGEEGTRHFQGMLKTPQVRFAKVKKAFPRAHIEKARNSAALALYVNKKDTRIATYEATGVPSMFEYQAIIAERWEPEEFSFRRQEQAQYAPRKWKDTDDLALEYVDDIVGELIQEGSKGIEFIAINPMWRCSWKKFWAQIIARHASLSVQAEAQARNQTQDASSSERTCPEENNPESNQAAE